MYIKIGFACNHFIAILTSIRRHLLQFRFGTKEIEYDYLSLFLAISIKVMVQSHFLLTVWLNQE